MVYIDLNLCYIGYNNERYKSMTGANKNKNPYYVKNKDFSLAVCEYVKECNDAIERGEEVPKVTNYIAECFMKIANGLSSKGNFARYTYREDMVLDAIENCLRAIANYNIDASTRTGVPNAFGYFTQICYYAFLRRLAKEKRQAEIRTKFIAEGGIEDFMILDENDSEGIQGLSATSYIVDELREKINHVRTRERTVKEFTDSKIKKIKTGMRKNSVLEVFMSGGSK